MTPFEVLRQTTQSVFDLWVDVINHDRNKDGDDVEWVTSATADWH